MSTVLLCLCGCAKARHKVGKKACTQCGMCDAFELDGEVPASAIPEATAEPAVEPVPADELAAAFEASADPGVSTSARLRAVEQEREELAERMADLEMRGTNQLAATVEAQRERDDARGERDQVQKQLNELSGKQVQLGRDLAAVTKERNEARGEVARLRVDLGEVTTERGDLRARVELLEAQLEHAEQYARDLQDNGDVPTTTDHLLAQADATKVPAIVRTGDSIRDLIGQLREQLAEHDRVDGLRTELAQIEERAEQLRAEIAKAEADEPAKPQPTDREVREWARAMRIDVDPRGRVSMALRNRYLEATSA